MQEQGVPMPDAPLSRWHDRISVAERALSGYRHARAALHDEVCSFPEDEHLLDSPDAAGCMSYFLAILRELGDEVQADYSQAISVIGDWIRNALVPAEHVCVVHNRLATALAESGNGHGALKALAKAQEAARTPLERAITLAQRGVLEAQLGHLPRAEQYASQAEALVPGAEVDEVWLDVRMHANAVLFRAELVSGFRNQERILALASRIVEVCDRQIDRWGDDHPRALEAVVMMASAQHAVAQMQVDVEAMERTTDVLEIAAQRSSAMLGSHHPQSRAARVAVEEAFQVTERFRIPNQAPTPQPPLPEYMAAASVAGTPQRIREQFDQVQRSMPGVPLAMGPDNAAEFFYEKGVLLARDGEEARLVEDTVRSYFTEALGLDADHVRRASPETSRSGITRIQVGDPGHGDRRGDRAVAHALRSLREHEGRAGRRLASRNHVVTIAGTSNDEPVPAPLTQGTNPAPAEAGYDADTAVNVLVIDNGLTHDFGLVPMLAHVQGDFHDTETDNGGALVQYVGHGTFIAGILAAVAPNTNVTVRNTLNQVGAILESEFGERLFDAVDEHGWPDLISLSAGTANGSSDGLLGVETFMNELRCQRTLLVAAAGDAASATPFWPAAYAEWPEYQDVVLSVGALRGDGEYGACFSNYGPWVNVYAPSERLTSTLTGFDVPVPYVYQHTTYEACRFGFTYACTCQYPRHTGVLSTAGTRAKSEQVMFEGYAHWSGTSFATPVAAGMIAAHMTANKESDSRAARRQLLAVHPQYAEVHGAHVPALRPPTWRPSPVVSLNGYQ
jgi:hypothetical protein